MKVGDQGKLSYSFDIERMRLGTISAGGIFLYRKRLWVALNPAKESGGKLVRTLEGTTHKAKILPSKTLVYFLQNGKAGILKPNE